MKHVTLGTAGHIDHGKTALVKYLTGTDTDRLLEEKNWGMTIELGFASLKLPSGDLVSIVDVPMLVVARIRVLGGDRIEPMSRGYAQLRLEEPIVALRGDRFILRTYSPVKTLGGGQILFHHTHHRKRFDLEAFQAFLGSSIKNLPCCYGWGG